MVSALLTQNVRLAVSVQDEDSVMSANETEGRDVRIAISVRATSQSLGWIGAEAGIFQRLGLNITFPAMETAAVEAVAGLVRGEWDFVEVGGAPIVQGVLDGHDTVMLLAAEQAPLVGRYLVARQDFTAPMNLRGGRIGILTEAGQTGISAREMLRQWGITATLVPLGTYPKIYAALRAQDIDAGILSEEYRLAAQRGFGSTAFSIPASALPPALTSTRQLIRRRRGLVARVVQGYVEAIHLFKTNRVVVIPLLHRFLQQFDQEIIEDIYEYYTARFQRLPLPSMSAIQQMLNQFAATYPVAHTLPPTAVTDISMLEEMEQSGLVVRLYGG
jgi:ABC-type nitrate/sulfonate/bicarbonate transport system substrate-binding protein